MLGHPSSCALGTAQPVRDTTVPLRETVRPVGHIDLVLDREHDAHETRLGQVCEFD